MTPIQVATASEESICWDIILNRKTWNRVGLSGGTHGALAADNGLTVVLRCARPRPRPLVPPFSVRNVAHIKSCWARLSRFSILPTSPSNSSR